MLDEILARIWSDLTTAIGQGSNPYRLMQLATVDAHGQPDTSTVVLRDADTLTGTVLFFVDKRSAKYTQLRGNPRVALVALAPGATQQLRLQGQASERPDTPRYWQQARATTQALFRHGGVPGAVIDSPAAAYRQPEDGLQHFAVISVRVNRLEWLDLTRPVHQRARFVRQADDWQAHWIAP
ncbi:Pyridoxamine 5'-phosphate oxidase-related FMN-binding [Pseudomonas reidholzensis]|uniref:Pyridoxamine 5'-phosphate oxidase-related FMN-binding n=1 Tax=Pseudomonas reidholzensis TaxID=1785162 RepID=A0A383S051_9PSED|nr:pyridoxamine 5'-phosphate oxidase family protein [Pseudomonas reidholzensis]SYX92081.1 Pyridoxamine 5'-phosphate oxidase-related FMN-binding [Pseudomonas reidholzensis]